MQNDWFNIKQISLILNLTIISLKFYHKGLQENNYDRVWSMICNDHVAKSQNGGPAFGLHTDLSKLLSLKLN
jgi:hypothetical protein